MTGRLHKLLIAAAIFLLAGFLPAQVHAASASVYPSPSKTSVTEGDTFSVQVRVNSGSDTMNAAEGRLNFNSAKVKYLSYSVDGSPFDVGVAPTITSSSFKISRARTGGSITSDRLLATVNFKARDAGTASFNIDQAEVADEGVAFDSVSVGGASVKINEPSSSGSGGGSSGSGSGGNTGIEIIEEQPPPEFTQGPKLSSTQSTLNLTFTADKPVTVKINYGTDGSRESSKNVSDPAAEHDITIGEDEPLVPGTEYSLRVEITDEDGNSAKSKVLSARTTGVDYELVILDKDGRPLANHPVELHSEPVKATTDGEGRAVFEDVAPGEHTLVFTIDGFTVRQAVMVGIPLSLAQREDADDESTKQLVLPFRLSAAPAVEPDSTDWQLLALAALAGGALAAAAPYVARHWPTTAARAKLLLAYKTVRGAIPKLHRKNTK